MTIIIAICIGVALVLMEMQIINAEKQVRATVNLMMELIDAQGDEDRMAALKIGNMFLRVILNAKNPQNPTV